MDNVAIEVESDPTYREVIEASRRVNRQSVADGIVAAAREIAQSLNGFTVIVTKSTVPVGTNRAVKQVVKKANPALEFGKIELAVGRDRDHARLSLTSVMKPLGRLEDGTVLDRGHQHDRAGLRRAHRARSADDRQIVGFCAATNESDLGWMRPDGCRQLRPSLFEGR